MTWIAAVAITILVVAAVAGLVRIAKGPDDPTRAVVADLLYFCAVAIFVIGGVLRDTAVLFDVAVIAMLCAILATTALARMVTRGRR